jgi:hypothetical protein
MIVELLHSVFTCGFANVHIVRLIHIEEPGSVVLYLGVCMIQDIDEMVVTVLCRELFSTLISRQSSRLSWI